MLNKNFRDMLSALNDAGAEYLVVGAYAVGAYIEPRATGDLGIWVRPVEDNAGRVWHALEQFGAPRRNLKPSDLCGPDLISQIGIAPNRIDILTSIDGVEFDEAWQNRNDSEVEGLSIPFLGREQLLKNKRATGRPKDLADVAYLEQAGDK